MAGKGPLGAKTGNEPIISSSRLRLREEECAVLEENGIDPMTGEFDADLFPGRTSIVGRFASDPDPLLCAGSMPTLVSIVGRPRPVGPTLGILGLLSSGILGIG